MNNFALLHLNDIISLRKKMMLFQIAMLDDNVQPSTLRKIFCVNK